MKYDLRLISRMVIFSLTSILFACGGSGGNNSSSGGNSNTNSEAEIASPTYLSGTAVKGIISNGIVEAFAVDGGTKGTLLVSTTTNTSGNYSVTIPSTYKGPILLEISALENGSSLMLCDSAIGCGSYTGTSENDVNQNGAIDFGENFSLSNNFLLSALVPSNINNSNTIHADITVITHLAAAYAGTFPQGFDNLSAELAITQIASIFSIDVNPLTLDVPSINDLNAFSQATSNEKTYALLTSSLANFAANDMLISTIQNLTDSFSLNNGQLINNSDSDDTLTVTSLLNAAINNLSTIAALSPDQDYSSISNQLNTLLTTATNAPSNSLTTGEASPTAGSSELAKVEQFISDLQSWQGVVNVLEANNSVVSDGTYISNTLMEHQSPLLQAFALASQNSAVVAVPDLAINAACESLGNVFMVLLCQTLIADKSIEEICDVALNLSLFGVSVCEFLNDLTLPLGNGIWVNYAIYDGTARVYGELEGVEMDVFFENSHRTTSTIRFDVSGSISDSESEISFGSGNVSFHFEGGLSSDSLRLPDSASLNLNANSSSTRNSHTVSFEGDLAVTASLEAIIGSDQTGNNGIDIRSNYTGDFDIDSSLEYYANIALNNIGSPYFSANLQQHASDQTTVGSLKFSSPNTLSQNPITPSNYKLDWAGRSYYFSFDEEPEQVSISNQDNVAMLIELDTEDNEPAGDISINNAQYADITLLNGSVVITLPDNSEAMLYQ